MNGLYRFNKTRRKTHHLEEDNGQNSTDGEEDGHHRHNDPNRRVPEGGKRGNPSAEDEGAVVDVVKEGKLAIVRQYYSNYTTIPSIFTPRYSYSFEYIHYKKYLFYVRRIELFDTS